MSIGAASELRVGHMPGTGHSGPEGSVEIGLDFTIMRGNKKSNLKMGLKHCIAAG